MTAYQRGIFWYFGTWDLSENKNKPSTFTSPFARMSRRPEPVYFGRPWINKVIDFTPSPLSYPTKQWRIVCKLSELCLQETESVWKEFNYDPMESIAVFECVDPTNNNETAIMKIYMQSVSTSLLRSSSRNTNIRILGYHMQAQRMIHLMTEPNKQHLILQSWSTRL